MIYLPLDLVGTCVSTSHSVLEGGLQSCIETTHCTIHSVSPHKIPYIWTLPFTGQLSELMWLGMARDIS